MSPTYNYHQGQLWVEKIKVADLAGQFATPLYIYSRSALENNWLALERAMGDQPHLICYAVKANSNIAILNCLAKLGSGFDIVSGGELARVLAAGGSPEKIVFSGVGKSAEEIAQALEVGIGGFNVESAEELTRIAQIAKRLQKTARISLRINPHIDAFTHPYISTGLKENKFGIDSDEAMPLFVFAKTLPYIELQGMACHIGSQLTELQPFIETFDLVCRLWTSLKNQGILLPQVDFGGGIGVNYTSEHPPSFSEYAQALITRVNNPWLKIILEPGRAIVANAGILLTKVEYLKHTPDKNFAIVDAGMNDLLRPALYQAEQDIIQVQQPAEQILSKHYDVVGPVCETADFLGKDRSLAIKPGDLLAVKGSGAYGFSMSSNYNTRPRPAEILVDGEIAHLIRRRETTAELFSSEQLLPMEML